MYTDIYTPLSIHVAQLRLQRASSSADRFNSEQWEERGGGFETGTAQAGEEGTHPL